MLGALVVLTAAREDPFLSVDSITYISAAERLRGLDGFVDFTGEPLSHFPPVFPLLLAPGGRNLVWASFIGAACAGLIAALLYTLLASRVRSSVAVGTTLVYLLSQAMVRIGATVWSETPYVLCAVATVYVLSRQPITVRRAALGGLIAGIGFLTRYAGAGLVGAGLVMVVVAAAGTTGAARTAGTVGGRRHTRNCAAAFLAAPIGLATVWIGRNVVATGDPLGPHFEGGAGESISMLFRRTAEGLGRLVLDLDTSIVINRPVGTVVILGIALASGSTFVRRTQNIVDVGMAAFALASIILPVVSRAVAGTDVSARLLAPTLLPVVYFAAIAANRLMRSSALLGVGAVVVAVSCVQGIRAMIDFPDRTGGSAAIAESYSPELYQLVDSLADDVNLLTNNPQRVWWTTGHFPTWFAFTEPRPGNSHFPLSPQETLDLVCDADSYLAWFPGLDNAGGATPAELRPDLAALIDLNPVESVSGGTLFALTAADLAACD